VGSRLHEDMQGRAGVQGAHCDCRARTHMVMRADAGVALASTPRGYPDQLGTVAPRVSRVRHACAASHMHACRACPAPHWVSHMPYGLHATRRHAL